jgi:hypothetical protein
MAPGSKDRLSKDKFIMQWCSERIIQGMSCSAARAQQVFCCQLFALAAALPCSLWQTMQCQCKARFTFNE